MRHIIIRFLKYLLSKFEDKPTGILSFDMDIKVWNEWYVLMMLNKSRLYNNMTKKTVYFEFFGKKMKSTVEASSDDKAIAMIRNRVNIIKVETEDDVVCDLRNIFGMRL